MTSNKNDINNIFASAEKTDFIDKISIYGAREHNLKNVNLQIPRDKFVVITGVSGSGKSSLAFYTIYAEGQRRYLECLSPNARQFIDMLKKPDVDRIEGLSPAISIEQKTISKHPRSTVGTVTEIYDYLRLLFAKIGTQYCTNCNIPVVENNLNGIQREILEKFSDRQIIIMAPLIRARKGHYKELFAKLLKEGYTKVRVDEKIIPIKDGMQLERYKIHNIELVIDRIAPNQQSIFRLQNSLEIGLKMGDDTVFIQVDNSSEIITYSTKYSCPKCGLAYDKLSPNNFSFNTRYGACEVCDGIGEVEEFDYDKLMPDKTLSIKNGGIITIGDNKNSYIYLQLIAFCEKHNIPINEPISNLTDEQLDKVMNGNDDNEVVILQKFGYKVSNYKQHYPGIITVMKQFLHNPPTESTETHIRKFMTNRTCPTCNGERLKQSSLFVRIDNNNISDIAKFDIEHSYKLIVNLPKKLTSRQNEIAELILKEIRERLSFLINVGLSYLSINRSSKTLSGGEAQRIRLASQIGSQLVGITYILDEPSIGLHPHDNQLLINSLKELRDIGNTVLVVEHDKAMIEQSDYFIDVGPAAGVNGGEIVFAEEPAKLKKLTPKKYEHSCTAKYLMNQIQIEIKEKQSIGNGQYLTLIGAKGNNLKNVTLEIPLGKFVCITGLSGSGKSSLINDTLYPILSKHFYHSLQTPLPFDKIEGLENIDKVIEIDQSPIGKTARSNPATYTGVFTPIREFFAMLPEAKIRGYKSNRFSFNVTGGRCEVCQGAGIKKIEMNFLPDVYVPCDTCDGKRYNDETLQVKYKSHSIADVLEMTIEQAVEVFSELPQVRRKLQILKEVGLGYIKLGQQSPTLSGGEAQRVKLATELSKRSTGKTLYLLDEPTTGLHFKDVKLLLDMLEELVVKGNTVVVIEHNLDVIKFADWIIDMGPLGGEKGGEILAVGMPLDIAENPKSLTGKYLKEEINLVSKKGKSISVGAKLALPKIIPPP